MPGAGCRFCGEFPIAGADAVDTPGGGASGIVLRAVAGVEGAIAPELGCSRIAGVAVCSGDWRRAAAGPDMDAGSAPAGSRPVLDCPGGASGCGGVAGPIHE